MLVSFAYVVVRRLFELMLLLAQGDRSKELEIVVLRHELSILRRQVARPRLFPRDRLLLAIFESRAAAPLVAGVLRQAADALALASAARPAALDVSAAAAGPATA